MTRLITTLILVIPLMTGTLKSQDSYFPSWESKLLEWEIIENHEAISTDTLDPKKALWLEKQEAKAQRKLAKRETKRLKGIHQSMNPENTSAARGNKKLALALFDNQAYAAALEAFNLLSAEDKSSSEIMSKMAVAYNRNAQYEAAEYWYGRLVHSSKEEKYYLAYAQVLQNNNKCTDAVYWYKKYADESGASIEDEATLLAGCEKSNEIAHFDQIEIYNAESLNTEHLDFAPIPYGNGVVFTSSRVSDRFQVNKDCWTKENYTDLFYAEGNGCDYEKIETLDGQVNGRFHDGAASFAAGGEVMFFTRNNYKGKGKDGLIDLKIWQSTKKNGIWQKAEELPFNSNDFTTCHPTLSADGLRLYFASNRPGGFGGMDIYVTHFVDGNWQKPMNLGAAVNSSKNELFPFIDQSEILYYASNGFPGKGGLDLFKVQKLRKSDENSWQNSTNMGTPFNSSADDFGFYVRPEGNNGFLTSNRKGGKGGDDIYCWQGEMTAKKVAPALVAQNFCVSNQESGDIVQNAKVNINKLGTQTNSLGNGDLLLTLKPLADGQYTLGVSNSNQGIGADAMHKNISSTQSGGFDFKIDPEAMYQIDIDKKGYEPFAMTYSGTELINMDGCLGIKKESCYALKGKINTTESMLLENVRLKIFDRTTNTNLEIPVDKDGNYETCIPCGHDYRINGRMAGFDSDFKNFNTIGADCAAGGAEFVNINLRKRKVIATGTYVESPSAPAPAPTYAAPCYTCAPVTCFPCQPLAVNTTFKKTVTREVADVTYDFETKNIRKGAIISLDDVYYDYNKSNIRNDASEGLDKLLAMMTEHSNMTVEMRAHTDARGNAWYNQKLSQKRAMSARQYLISRGINCDRITIKGFGERRLINKCADGIDCDEASHQLNRRTEFKVTNF